jgi:hypothetical protein
MRTIRLMAAAVVAAGGMTGAAAQEAFDACEVFTQAEAAIALGSAAAAEPANPKVKKPKVIPTCTYFGSKEGKSISAAATFRFAKSEADAQRAFDDERLKFQTKPMLIGGAAAFWSAKQGNLQLLRGRTWLVVSVGGATPAERDAEGARKVAEALVKKL